MSEETIIRRKARDRERYLRQRDERLARQREYYRDNRDEILAKKREKALCRPSVGLKERNRADIYHEWYERNREAHIAKANERWRKLREANTSVAV